MRSSRLLWSAWLLILVLAVFGQVGGHDFIDYDDYTYVVENPHVRSGLSPEGLSWAFTTTHAGNWHPVTWLSHMLDVQLFGLRAGAHHLTNVAFHAASAVMLFLLFSSLTGATGRSAVTAALFAIHPLHVESVAWVAERKDVLSAFFWVLTMTAYLHYARRPGVRRYLLVAACLAVGLMAKPMVVTLPFVLLLLDYWPLRRIGGSAAPPASSPPWRKASPALSLVWEKVPLLLLAAAAGVITYLAQQGEGAVKVLALHPLGLRAANAFLSYARYLGKAVWPSPLSVFYPATSPVWWQVAGAAALLGAATLYVVRKRREKPYLLFGWLWYVGTMVPVIGIIQAGDQSMADRYTYLPLTGIAVMVLWGADDLLRSRGASRRAGASLVTVITLILGLLAFHRAGHWQNSFTLFRHDLAVTSGNYALHNNLGVALTRLGRVEEAGDQFDRALEINSLFPATHYNLGVWSAQQGKIGKSIAHYREALRLRTDYPEAHNNLGVALAAEGRASEAAAHYREALRLHPDYAEAYTNLGIQYDLQRQSGKAERAFRKAIALDRGNPLYHYNLGIFYVREGRTGEARAEHEILRQLDDTTAARLLEAIRR